MFIFSIYFTTVRFFGHDGNGTGFESQNTVNNPTDYSIVPNSTYMDGVWRHWAVTVNSGGNWICYLNGNTTPIKSGYIPYPFTAPISPVGFTFGGY